MENEGNHNKIDQIDCTIPASEERNHAQEASVTQSVQEEQSYCDLNIPTEVLLNDSGDCPLLETGLPPPPEHSPPPLLPNEEDEESGDNLLTIENVGVASFSPLLLPLASPKNVEMAAVVQRMEKSGTTSDRSSPDLLVKAETGRELTSAEHDQRTAEITTIGRVFANDTGLVNSVDGKCEDELLDLNKDKMIDLAPNFGLIGRNNGDNKLEMVRSSTDEGCSQRQCVSDANSATNAKRQFEMKSLCPTISPYASSTYCAPAGIATAIQSTNGASNLYGRVRNASANSGYSGMVLLRHGGGAGYQVQEHKQQSPSERELSLAQISSSSTAYENAMGKDKTQRWSFAGTAPEVALLRLKLENVERELKDLRGKHEATTNDYQAVLHQLELCRAAKCRQDVDLANVTSELTRLKAEYEVSCQQKSSLERQLSEWQFNVHSKQMEMDELRQQARELSHQPRELASKLMEEYEEVRIEKEKLREQCRYLDNANAELRAALHASQNEACQMRARYERELDELRIKSGNLESRQMAAYQQLHRMVQERDLLRSEREMLQQQLDDACADRTRLINCRQKQEEEFQHLRQLHDSAVSEYRRVMSERDSILKENERNSEEKTQLIKKLKSLENEHHSVVDQMKSLEAQLRDLQHRQHQKFETSREDLMSFNSSSSHSVQQTPTMAVRRMLPPIPVVASGGHDTHGHHAYMEQRSIASSESEVALITSRAQEEELDEMRRQMESMKEQLEVTKQQSDDAKLRRDWALSERQRIVAERDSMRAMCDTLRRERDDAITRLASAIRDTDELQRQKQVAERECKKLREKIDLNMKQKSNDGGNQMNCSPSNSRDSNSRDSAIDTDMAEWEIETLELSVDSAQKGSDLGIEFGGGRDDPAFGGTVPIYVKSVLKNSKFENSLRPYDCIVQVNNIDITSMERRSVLDILRNSTAVKMVIRRRRLIGMKLISVPLSASNDGDMGVLFEDGVYVSRIKTGSSAAKAGNLAIGDRLVYVNDLPVQGRSASDVHELLKSYKDCSVVLAVMKSPPVISPTTSWPGGFTNTTSNYGVVGNRGSAKNEALLSPSSRPISSAHRDESVQTLESSSEQLLADPNLSSSGSCLALPKKQESLLDKVHDKFFRKAEKKPVVKAFATVSGDSGNTSVLKTSARFERSRYSRTSSVCSSGGRGGIGASPEQQVLQQLDRILEDSEKESPLVNKNLTAVTNTDQANGGTWPKFRGLPTPAVVVSGTSTISQQQSKKKSPRKAIFNVFPQPVAPSSGQSRPVESSTQEYMSLVGTGLTSPNHYVPVHLRSSNNNTQRKRQPGTTRPLSYHPAAAVYSVSSNSSIGTGPTPSMSASSTAVLPISGRHDHLGTSTIYSARKNSGLQPSSPFVSTRSPSSSSSSRKLKAFSQYEPLYDDPPVPRGAPMPATMVKEHHPTHRAYVTPVRKGINSPCQRQIDFGNLAPMWSPRSPSALHPMAHQLEQPDDVSSMISLGSPVPNAFQHPFNRMEYDSLSLRSPSQNDVRTIHIEKQFPNEGLGIRIISHGNGVFISAVEKDSLAFRNGLQVGDQLLDVCGINMRSANLQAATNVLSQLVRTDQITLKVQYNQNRYLRAASDYHHQQSAASTPRATPNSIAGSYVKNIPSRECSQMQQSRETVGGDDIYGNVWSEPRFVFIKRDSSVWPPFTLIGGNATGVFIDTVKDNQLTPGSLRPGDQILEFDGVDFRKLTMEQAQFELQQRSIGAEISMLVQYNEAKYQRSKRATGDLFYVRVTVDRQAENRDELNFKAGDILRVDNTVFNGVVGLWRAWAVDQEGRELFCGIIPSRAKLEDEFIFRRSGSEISAGDGSSEGGGSRRGTIRRSLKFIRRSSRSNHQRAPSKDSRDMVESADAVVADELYQRVERLDYKQKRPVLIVGPLLDILIAKLMEDYPKMFAHCAPECVQPASVSILNQGLQQNIYIDYQKRDKLFEITRVAALKELMDQGFHCILRVSLSAIERLHRLQIYPVVIFVKFKDAKQIKEFSEGQVHSKEAKELFQQSAALETDFRQLFSAIINAQHGIKYICQRIADAVEHEQKKTLWILSSETL